MTRQQNNMIEEITQQKKSVEQAFAPLLKAYQNWVKAMDKRIVDCQNKTPGWTVTNPDQREVDILRKEITKFSEKMGISTEKAVQKMMNKYQQVMDEAECNALI